eukprot:NODE_64_length_2288_cov_27.007613.p1 GENE.NODE_64_length_2288_cov_27.007613~~NODE_64_length_2288_cov_27.007613.p1  ORF type:complete len:717 (+),score=238.67 NODE_64_length_2288_cov_27.007613:149-2152(+)
MAMAASTRTPSQVPPQVGPPTDVEVTRDGSARWVKWLIANVRYCNESYKACLEAAHQAADMCNEVRMDKMEGFIRYNIAEWLLEVENHTAALVAAEESHNIFKKIRNNGGWEAGSLAPLLKAYFLLREQQQGITVVQEAIDRFQASGDRRQEALVQNTMAHIRLERGENMDALRAVEKCVALCQALEDKAWLARAKLTQNQVHFKRKEHGKAINTARESINLFQEVEETSGMHEALHLLVQTFLEKKEFPEALRAANDMLGYFKRAGIRKPQARVLLSIAAVHSQKGEHDMAVNAAMDAVDIYRAEKDLWRETIAYDVVSHAHLAAEDLRGALRYQKKRVNLLKKLGAHAGTIDAMKKVSLFHLRNGDPTEAVRAAHDAEVFCSGTECLRHKHALQMHLTQCYFAMAVADPEMKTDRDEFMGIISSAISHGRDAVSWADLRPDETDISAQCHFLLAQSLHTAGENDEALTHVDKAMEDFDRNSNKSSAANIMLLRAQVLFGLQRQSDATAEVKQALVIFKEEEDAAGEEVGKQVLKYVSGDLAIAVDSEETTGPDPEAYSKRILEIVQDTVGGDVDVLVDSPLMESGVDSLSSLELRNTLAKEFAVNLPASLTFDYPSTRQMTDEMTCWPAVTWDSGWEAMRVRRCHFYTIAPILLRRSRIGGIVSK